MRPPDGSADATPSPAPSRLIDIARLFLKLGATAFGGPAAHIAMMDDEVVRRRRWLTREQFLDYVGATNLIPGPNSTELALHVGHARAGWPGLIVAGTCFIVPAALIVGALAWAYVAYGSLPEVASLLQGIKAAVAAIVAQALWSLARTAIKSAALGFVAVAALVAVAMGVHELLVLAVAGAVSAGLAGGSRTGTSGWTALWLAPWATTSAVTVTGAATPAAVGLAPLALVFLKAGALLFGSGYVLLAFLRADLVERLGWLTEPQLLDAIAVGQVTPGPLFTTATFIGYVLAGWTGAGVATAAIFLPAFIFVAVSGPMVPKLRRSRTAGAVLDGVNVASLALMAVVSWQLGRAALVDAPAVALFAASLATLMLFRINSAWLVAAGGLVGWLRS